MSHDGRPTHARALEATTNDAARWLASLAEPVVSWRPARAGWSTKEIIGHLIDSAANNHQRFASPRAGARARPRRHARARELEVSFT